MNKCNKCNIEVMDDSIVCPLCNTVLDRDEENSKQINVYPDFIDEDRIFNLVMRIFVFCSILIGAVLVTINYLTFSKIWWSAICIGAMVYLCITLKYSVQRNSNYIMKLIIQTIGAILLTILIDNIIGYRGWSVNYVLPSAIILVDIGIAIMMILNSTSWQSYILFQIFMIFTGFVSFVMYELNVITYPIMTFIALGVSLLFFLGTIILGGKRATTELKRRFHV